MLTYSIHKRRSGIMGERAGEGGRMEQQTNYEREKGLPLRDRVPHCFAWHFDVLFHDEGLQFCISAFPRHMAIPWPGLSFISPFRFGDVTVEKPPLDPVLSSPCLSHNTERTKEMRFHHLEASATQRQGRVPMVFQDFLSRIAKWTNDNKGR